MSERWRDLLPGLALLLLCAVLFALTTTFERVPAAFAQGMQASAMPRLLIALMALLCLIMIWQGRREPEPARRPITRATFLTAALLITASALFPMLGVTLTLFLVCLAMPVLWGERRPHLIVPFALAVPLGIYLLFVLVLRLRLPQGVLTPFL